MRRWVYVITALVVAACVSSAVAFTTPPDKLRTMSGEISAIDAKAMTMSVKEEVAGSGVEETNFIVDPSATIRMHGLKGKNLAQLQVGDYVTVRYIQKDGKNVAMEIQHS